MIRECTSFCVDTVSLQLIRSITAARCSSKAGPATSLRPAFAQESRTRWGVTIELDQLTVLPPPTVDPAAMANIPSAELKNPPRRNSVWYAASSSWTKSDSL